MNRSWRKINNTSRFLATVTLVTAITGWVLHVFEIVSLNTALSFTFTPLFYLLLFFLLRFLWSKIENNSNLLPTNEPSIFNCDWLVAIGIYAIITFVFFYPTLQTISTAIIGPPEDNLKYLWNMWWSHKAIFSDSASLTFSKYIYYPEGSSLLYNDYSWYNLFLSFVLRIFFNLTTTYNLLIMHSFVLSGIGAFLLIKYLTKNSYFSLIGGYIFAFNPSHYAHALHHMNIASIQFIPFFVLFFIKAIKSNSKRDLLLACFFFLLNAFCDWNYLIFACFFIALSYVYLAIRRKQVVLFDVVKKSTLIIGSTLVILSPWLVPMMLTAIHHPEITETGHNIFVADIAALITPQPQHLIGSAGLFSQIYSSITGNPWESLVYLGIVNIALLLFIGFRRISMIAKLLPGLVAFLLLAAGSYLHVAGKVLPVVLPYKIIEYIPFLANARNPSRNIVFVYLFLAVIVTVALYYLYHSMHRSKLRNLLLMAVTCLIIADFFSLSTTTANVSLPTCYSAIKKNHSQFGILDLPASWKNNARYMMYQTFHGIPIVQGLLPRKIGESLIDNLALGDFDQKKQQLIENKVKYIVIHKKLLRRDAVRAISLYKQHFTVIYEDADNILCQVY